MKNLIYICALLLPFMANAQKKDAKVAFNGYKGNYIYNLFKPASAAHPDGDVVGFRLDRKLATESNWTSIQSFSSPSNYDELVQNAEDGKKKAYEYRAENAYSVNEVWPIYKLTFSYDSLGVYLTQQHLAIAFKILLVDTTANAANNYQYRVVQLKRDGSEYGKYTSNAVGTILNTLAVNRPKATNRRSSGGVFRLSFAAKASAVLPQALLIKRKAENDRNFKRSELQYSITQNGDSVLYEIVDDNVREDALYQYVITPVNRFGGDGKLISDTLSINSISQKMLIPKAFVAVIDSIKKKVNLSWGFIKPELVSMVKVYRSEDYEDGYVYIGSTSKSTYEDQTIIPGKKYYYYLNISDQLGRTSERSTKVFALMQNTVKPNAPLYVEVNKSANGNIVSWQDYNLENRGYKIYRTNQIQGDLLPLDGYVYLDQKLQGKYSFIDTAKTVGDLVGYAVVAESMSNLLSDFSKTVYLTQQGTQTPLEAPVLLDFQKDKRSVRIFWQQNTGNAGVSGINIYRKLGNGNYEKINSRLINVAKTTYTDSLALNGQDLFYKITAVTSVGTESVASNEIQVDFATTVYPASSLKSSFNVDKSAIEIYWQPSQSVIAKYELYRFTRGNEPVKVAEIKNTAYSYTDRGFDKQKTNYYYVVAIGNNGIASVSSNQSYQALKQEN